MNCIRNQFSKIKGGRLALACVPARVVTLVVSDVPGDDPSIIASGPTIPQNSSRSEARQLSDLYGLKLPAAAASLLMSDGNLPPDSACAAFKDNLVHIIASATLSLEAAAAIALEESLAAHILSDSIEGEANSIGQMHGAMVREIATHDRPFSRPCVILSGGETTVNVRGKGRGGRNAEFAMGLAQALQGLENVAALAADTDGIDGRSENAGAFCNGTSLDRMRAAGVDPLRAAMTNDTAQAFEIINDAFVTGPTGTNVNDFRAIIVR